MYAYLTRKILAELVPYCAYCYSNLFIYSRKRQLLHELYYEGQTYITDESSTNTGLVGFLPIYTGLQVSQEIALELIECLHVSKDGRNTLIGEHVWSLAHLL